MSNEMTIQTNDIEPFQIGVAKNHEICLNSDRFTPESPIQDIHLLSEVPEVLELHQAKVETARLAFSEKPF